MLGLTGSIATGKSSVSEIFKKNGIPVVDADLVARQVVEPGQPGLQAICNQFGSEYIFPNGVLKRKKLGELVFSDYKARQKLDQLLAPFIREALEKERARYLDQGVALLVLDIPLLYEAEYQNLCQAIMLVYVPENLQLERLMARDHLRPNEAFDRMQSQISIERKLNWADIVIDNSGSPAETEQQVEAWLAISGYLGH
ncbi:dephospho-CoA kinase [Aerococcus urinaehominis]|uniref:dephospho-CoA kinase n=1 Tax=Aerococcus urinaehominis TaxID=128944 RepID=UPI002E10D401|nr:dephospho-CoA kinase [Aerococcus urinaehominis]